MVDFILLEGHVYHSHTASVMEFFNLIGYGVRATEEIDTEGVTNHVSFWASGHDSAQVEGITGPGCLYRLGNGSAHRDVGSRT